MSHASVIGIVGGTGLYELDGLTDQKWQRVDSPFGAPSDELLFGRLGEHQVVFLPRHGRGHRIPPHEINFRANIDALKRAGVTQVISVSAVGSLRDDLPPGTFVRRRSVHRSHAAQAEDVLRHRPRRARLDGAPDVPAPDARTSTTTGTRARPRRSHEGGTYVVMEGPQFSSVAESRAPPRASAPT